LIVAGCTATLALGLGLSVGDSGFVAGCTARLALGLGLSVGDSVLLSAADRGTLSVRVSRLLSPVDSLLDSVDVSFADSPG
jgi:hypothetical protein